MNKLSFSPSPFSVNRQAQLFALSSSINKNTKNPKNKKCKYNKYNTYPIYSEKFFENKMIRVSQVKARTNGPSEKTNYCKVLIPIPPPMPSRGGEGVVSFPVPSVAETFND